MFEGISLKLQLCYFVKFIAFVAVQHIYILSRFSNARAKVSFKNIAGCLLLECIAMSAFSAANFNLWKKFRTFDFRVWILSLQIYNFISVSQTQIRENVDKLNNVGSYILTGNYRQLSVQ